MTRSTIDYGIDLGTTNSEIAVFKGLDTEVIKNNEGFENTPSAVWISAKGRLTVGRQAKEMVEADPENARQEFKRQMGGPEPLHFADSGRDMLPEELSAEVLKQLKLNVKEWKGEDITAAVITVPAEFNAAQIEATNRAARLAGLTLSPLVQEPVAAAMAYGFQSESDKVRWLVYDLGGGTFDTSLIHVRDGMIRVENHGGNKLLGGKDIDKAIVDSLLVPALTQKYSLKDFIPDNKKWRAAFAKLKLRAEEAKIRLSRSQSELIDITGLCVDDHGKSVDFEFELLRSDLERLAEPFILRTVHLCKEVLAEKRLATGDIEKVLLVGGPTLMPFLRQLLEDKSKGLGIPLEFSIDPFTVVARGAAVFAGTQPMGVPDGPPKAGEFHVRLEYTAIGSDPEPVLSGQVLASDGANLSGHAIEFVNPDVRPPWRSGRIRLSAEGAFMTTLWAEKGHQNIFQVELTDATGVRQQVTPSSLPYTVAVGGIENQHLIHGIGVALADNTVDWFFEKGTPLPARVRKILRTTVDARRGGNGDVIRVPVVEGGNKRADRNEIVGALEISAEKMKRDVPAGSEIEVTIEVDESRRFLTRVYLPLLDDEFERQLIKHTVNPTADELEKQVRDEKKRMEDLKAKSRQTNDGQARELLDRIESEGLEREGDQALAAARDDRDAADKCADRMRRLQIALDGVEDALEWPHLVSRAEEEIKVATEIINKHGGAAEKQRLATFVREIREAISHRDTGLLRTKHDELETFRFLVWKESDEFNVGMLLWMEEQKGTMTNPAEADRVLTMGRRAMNQNDRAGLKAAVQQLVGLLPRGVTPQVGGIGSTVGRGS